MKIGDLLVPLNSSTSHKDHPGLVTGLTDKSSNFNVVYITWRNGVTDGWDHNFVTKNFEVISAQNPDPKCK